MLHATDETVTEFAIEPYAADAPLHIVAMRTPQAKYATYSNWPETASTPLSAGQEAELYDYSTHSGRLELHNSAGHSALEEALRANTSGPFAEELRAPLPPRLVEAHARGFADYFSTARHAAVKRRRAAQTPRRTRKPAATAARKSRGASPLRPEADILTGCEVPMTAPAASSAWAAT